MPRNTFVTENPATHTTKLFYIQMLPSALNMLLRWLEIILVLEIHFIKFCHYFVSAFEVSPPMRRSERKFLIGELVVYQFSLVRLTAVH